MNVLFVGTGNGSWIMRGKQIGAALGARVTSHPNGEDWHWADVAVLVKHAGLGYASQAQHYDVPIIWDVLDCWQQPEQNGLSVEEGKALIAGMAAQIKPAVMIAATQRMADDIGGVYIPHHCRIGLTPKPVRDRVSTVAYDGQKKYLGRWYRVIEDECRRRGWRFAVNPIDLAQADILVAFRDGKWDGPLCQAWKSGVKFVNAMSAGRPIVTQDCQGVAEVPLQQHVQYLVSEWFSLSQAFDYWSDYQERVTVARDSVRHANRYTVSAIADTYYLPLLDRVASRVAA